MKWNVGYAAALVAALAGCASGPALQAGIYREREQGWAIAEPPAGWERVTVEGADIAFQGPAQASMALTSRCDIGDTAARVLARQLRVGLGPHELVAKRNVDLAGRRARLQWIALAEGRVKTVTRVAAPCVQDFVLVVPHRSTEPDSRVASQGRAASSPGFNAAERDFDAWWASFTPGPERAP